MDIENYCERLKNHVLTKVSEDPETYYLHEPGEDGEMETRIMSTLIVFTQENIVVTGDLSPGRNGVISCLGYGVEWFSGQLSGDYLASKFLDKVWEADYAQRDLNAYIKERASDAWYDRDRDTIKKLKELRDFARESHWIFENGHEFHNQISEYIVDLWDYEMGIDYPSGDYEWLIAIQRQFAKKYHEQFKEEAIKA